MKKPLVILTGPTAVGKTNLSLLLAEKIGGEIISADSMQVYKKMDIGTAKIMPSEMRGIPHYLVDILDPREEFNVTVFQKLAGEAVKAIYGRGQIPLVVGGTGFYIQALLYDVTFSGHDPDEKYREDLRRILVDKGEEYLYQLLKKVDPEYAAGVHYHNHRRVIRALEYYQETGECLSAHNRKMRERTSPYHFVYFVLTQDRRTLYEKIDRRVDKMMEAGLAGEVETLVKEGYGKDLVSMQGLGYKEFFDYFEGKATLDEVAERIRRDTRHFAKRQLTWFRREKDVVWIDRDDYRDEEAILTDMLRHLQEERIL